MTGPGRQPLNPLANAVYVASAHELAQLPPTQGPEVAFAGRSNAGKSSAINALVGHNRLAFVSKTPGRTQMINFFVLRGSASLSICLATVSPRCRRRNGSDGAT